MELSQSPEWSPAVDHEDIDAPEERDPDFEFDELLVRLDPEIYTNYVKDSDVDIDLTASHFPLSVLQSESHQFKLLSSLETQILCSCCERCHKYKPLGLFGFLTPRIQKENYSFISSLFSRFKSCSHYFLRRKYALTILSVLEDLYSPLCYDCLGDAEVAASATEASVSAEPPFSIKQESLVSPPRILLERERSLRIGSLRRAVREERKHRGEDEDEEEEEEEVDEEEMDEGDGEGEGEGEEKEATETLSSSFPQGSVLPRDFRDPRPLLRLLVESPPPPPVPALPSNDSPAEDNDGAALSLSSSPAI